MKACNECHFSEHCVRLLCKITGRLDETEASFMLLIKLVVFLL